MVVCVTSRGQCLYTHHCIVICVLNPSSCITLTAVSINYKKSKATFSRLFLIHLQHLHTQGLALPVTVLLLGPQENTCTTVKQPTKHHLLQYHATAVTSLLKYVNHQSFSFVRAGLYSPSSCSQGVWNVLTKPYGENTQTMSNFVIFPLRLDSSHTDTSQSSLPKPN